MPTAAPASRPWSTGHSAGCELRPRVWVFSTSGSRTLPWPPQREIHLRSAGKIFGRIVADRPEWTRGVKLSITTTSDPVDRDTKGIAEVVSRARRPLSDPRDCRRSRAVPDRGGPGATGPPAFPMSGSNPTRSRTSRSAWRKPSEFAAQIRSRETGDPVVGAVILIPHRTRTRARPG